jgi:hypothetical protein
VRRSTKKASHHQGLLMLFYRAALPLSSRTLAFVSGIVDSPAPGHSGTARKTDSRKTDRTR